MKNDRKQLLVALHELQEASASELRERLQFSQNQQVHYRFEQLEKYVEVSREEEQPGAASAAKIYTLSEAGKDWVREHSEEVSLSSISDAESIVSDLLSEVSDLREELEQSVEWHREDAGHYNQLRERVEDMEDEIRLVRTRASGAKGDTDRLRDDLDDVETRLAGVQRQIDRLESSVEEQSERHRALSEHLERIEQLQTEQSDRLNSLEERVEELEQQQPDGLLDLLSR